jgi:hypothetical protein
MVGSITARTPDYFGWLVAASVGALLSAVVTAICVKYEDRWLAGYGQQPSLVVHWPLRTAWGSCCEERNLYLPRSSRAILKKMNPQLKEEIMAKCKH